MLKLQRRRPGPHAMQGQMLLGGGILAVTLEDAPGNGKGPIPAGVYPIVLSHSPRFHALLPEVLNVPGFTDIRIHVGNTDRDTAGCILVGASELGVEAIAQSVVALDRLLARWRDWDRTTLTIEEAP